jgi:hypothetical protein
MKNVKNGENIRIEADALLAEAFQELSNQGAQGDIEPSPNALLTLPDRQFQPERLKLLDLGVEEPAPCGAAAPTPDGRPSIALDILESKGRDVERQVRNGLCEHVMMCPFLPPTIARALTAEVEAMALPVRPYSDLLSAVELEAIGVLASANGNGADHAAFQLPLTISAHLAFRLADALCEHLVAGRLLPRGMAERLEMHGRERALTQVLAADYRAVEFERLAVQLHGADKLTPTLILRTLCVGNLDFFQAAMAVRAGVPVAEANAMIFGNGQGSLEKIYRQAGLPGEFYVALGRAVDVVKELSDEGSPVRGLEITERIIAKLRMDYDNVCPEGLEHTLSQLAYFVLGRSEQAVRGVT